MFLVALERYAQTQEVQILQMLQTAAHLIFSDTISSSDERHTNT